MPSSDRFRTALGLALVLLATLGVYARSLSGELVYDDVLLVGRNPYVADLASLTSVFSRGYWDFLEIQDAEKIGYWRPLTAAALTLVWWVGDGATVAFHAFCVGVHLLATAVAWFLARRLTQHLAASAWIATFTALLFGLHPTHVESVAWISALNDPLFGVFCLLALLAHLSWRERGSPGVPLAAAAAFALSLLAKELAAATILLVLALDLGRRRGPDEPAGPWGGLHAPVRAYLPLAVVLAVYLVVRMVVFGSLLAGFERVTTDFGVPWHRLWLLRAEILGGALGLLALPLELNLFRRFRPDVGLADPWILAALGAIAAYVALLVPTLRRRLRPLAFGLLMIPAGLVPVLISVDSLGRFPLSDRFLYVPVFGFALAACLLLRRVLPAHVASVLALAVGGAYGWKSWERTGVWLDEERLFERSAEQSPRSVYVQWGLGRVYLQRANETRDPRYLERAFATFERAADLLVEAKERPTDLMVTSRDYLQVNLGLAWCYILQAQLDESEGYATPIAILEQLIERVTQIEQEAHEARELGIRVKSDYLDLEKLYTALGVAQRFSGRTDEALESFRRALSLQPNYVEAHKNLGRLYFELGRLAQARGTFQKALELQPGDLETKLLLAQVLHEDGQYALAERHARELHEREPELAEALVVLGAIRLARGDASDALTWLERATRADPRHGHAWYLKAKALLQRNAATEAIAAFRNAARLGPNSFEVNYDFGSFLLNSGAIEEALPFLVRAYELAPDPHLPLLRQTLPSLPGLTTDMLHDLSTSELRRGQLDMAESWLNAALGQDPDHAPSLLIQARLLRNRERHDEALDAMRRAVAGLRRSFAAHLELGLYLVERERPDEAVPYLERALELGPPRDWEPDARADAERQIRDVLDRIRAGATAPGDGAAGR